MKKLLLWLVMVVLMVVLLLGGAAAALYALTGENKLPQTHPTLGEAALEPNGYEWTVPVLGDVVDREFTSLTNLTVQKLGDMGDTTPALTLPDWVNRSELTLTGPDGAVAVQGDASAYNEYVYTQNGEYRLDLVLYRDKEPDVNGVSTGWYAYRASFTVNLQPKATLSTTSAPQGTVVALAVTGILDGSTPTLESDLGTVWFRKTTDGFMGYIPVSYNTPGGEHPLTLTCGSLVQELTLSVTESKTATVQVEAEAETEIPGASDQYKNAIWPLYTQGSGDKLWQGAFASPSTSLPTAEYGDRLMTDGSVTGRSTGLTYAAAEPGSDVSAPQSGTVAYAGELALTGGTVVIDHGCGVKSYLFGLGTVSVQTGQTVSRGDTVGTTTDVHDLIYELRIGNKSVDPAAAIKGSSGLQYQENK